MNQFTNLSQRAAETICANGSLKGEHITGSIINIGPCECQTDTLTVSNQITLGEMFTGRDGPAAMNVYWSVAIFTSDQTNGPV